MKKTRLSSTYLSKLKPTDRNNSIPFTVFKRRLQNVTKQNSHSIFCSVGRLTPTLFPLPSSTLTNTLPRPLPSCSITLWDRRTSVANVNRHHLNFILVSRTSTLKEVVASRRRTTPKRFTHVSLHDSSILFLEFREDTLCFHLSTQHKNLICYFVVLLRSRGSNYICE